LDGSTGVALGLDDSLSDALALDGSFGVALGLDVSFASALGWSGSFGVALGLGVSIGSALGLDVSVGVALGLRSVSSGKAPTLGNSAGMAPSLGSETEIDGAESLSQAARSNTASKTIEDARCFIIIPPLYFIKAIVPESKASSPRYWRALR
jgi:hypothetical protein